MSQILQNLSNGLVMLYSQLTPSACIAMVIVLLMILFVMRLQKPEVKQSAEIKPANNETYFVNQDDIQAIAGEDEIATQLDLARAYIEMDQKELAKEILQRVAHLGKPLQQQVAIKLAADL